MSKFVDNNGQDITHIYCFNAVMSHQDNEAIAKTIMRTKGVKVLAWCCNE